MGEIIDYKTREYKIGDKIYSQKTLVFGQIRQILGIIKKINLGKKGKIIEFTVTDLINLLGDSILDFISIILIPSDSTPKDKDNSKIAEEIEWEIKTDVISEVMSDFFIFNQISELQKKMMEMMKKMNLRIQKKDSTILSPKSQEEISPEESSSSGK